MFCYFCRNWQGRAWVLFAILPPGGADSRHPAVSDQPSPIRSSASRSSSLDRCRSLPPRRVGQISVFQGSPPPCFPWTATHLYFPLCPFETVHDSGPAHPTGEPPPPPRSLLWSFSCFFLQSFQPFTGRVGGGVGAPRLCRTETSLSVLCLCMHRNALLFFARETFLFKLRVNSHRLCGKVIKAQPKHLKRNAKRSCSSTCRAEFNG